MSAMPFVSFDPIAARYDATRGGQARGYLIADVLRPWLPTEGTVVEIGVGTAVVATAVARGGPTVIGLDLSAAMLDIAARRFPGPLVQADAAAVPIRTGSVAAVAAVWVFHLVGDLPGVFAECHRVLRPGGSLVAITIDNSRRVAVPEVTELENRYRTRQDELSHLEDVAAPAGFRLARVERLPAHARPVTPAETAANLEDRTWSWLWNVPDEAWATDVVPVIEALRSGAVRDRPLPHQVAHQLVVWER
jgi:ubiquinone/menaquinone biosynthesis C-methylase UbiE